jgi:hypothetical protein
MKVTKEIIDWQVVRDILEERLGKKYSIGYLQSTRSGFHRNKKVQEILKELGVMK